MDMYKKGLLDDTRNYTAMHFEMSEVHGNTSSKDPYHGFEAPLVPSYSANKVVIPKNSRVRITNLDVVSPTTTTTKTTTSTNQSSAAPQSIKVPLIAPLHILQNYILSTY